MNLTTEQVAEILGVQPPAVRKMVERGTLTPERPGANPLRFEPKQVFDLDAKRRKKDTTAIHALALQMEADDKAHAT